MSENTVGKYEMIFGGTASELSNKVTSALQKGAILYGHPFRTENVLYQAVVYPSKDA